MLSIMFDSGASEIVASSGRFPNYSPVQTTACRRASSSAAGNASEDITDVGEKYIQVNDSSGVESMAKFQICNGLGRGNVLASVSSFAQSGHNVVFQEPEYGSCNENTTNASMTYLRQQNGSYYLDVWVKRQAKDADRGQRAQSSWAGHVAQGALVSSQRMPVPVDEGGEV